jgi:anti-sigma factor RsiW
MECEQMSTWLDAYVDLELEPQQAADLVSHARSCAGCAASVLERQRLRAALIAGMSFHPAPRRTVQAIESSLPLRRGGRVGTHAPRWARASLVACVVLTGALLWTLVPLLRRGDSQSEVVRDAVSSHIRSLMGAHLADITTSDQHAVKPWFAGKLEFSPRVTDFASSGFPLAGGRLDYVAGRPAAAIVYTRRSHVINLLSCSDASVQASPPQGTTDRGFQAVWWSEPGTRFCAVSDLNAEELMAFVQLARSDANVPK